jgi:hypothetical protein
MLFADEGSPTWRRFRSGLSADLAFSSVGVAHRTEQSLGRWRNRDRQQGRRLGSTLALRSGEDSAQRFPNRGFVGRLVGVEAGFGCSRTPTFRLTRGSRRETLSAEIER